VPVELEWLEDANHELCHTPLNELKVPVELEWLEDVVMLGAAAASIVPEIALHTVLIRTIVPARCAFSYRDLHSRLPLSFTPLLRLKHFHACDQWHSSRVATFLPVRIENPSKR
jgi:hypothetical protein